MTFPKVDSLSQNHLTLPPTWDLQRSKGKNRQFSKHYYSTKTSTQSSTVFWMVAYLNVRTDWRRLLDYWVMLISATPTRSAMEWWWCRGGWRHLHMWLHIAVFARLAPLTSRALDRCRITCRVQHIVTQRRRFLKRFPSLPRVSWLSAIIVSYLTSSLN